MISSHGVRYKTHIVLYDQPLPTTRTFDIHSICSQSQNEDKCLVYIYICSELLKKNKRLPYVGFYI